MTALDSKVTILHDMLQMNPVSQAVDKPQAPAGNVQLLALLHAGFVLTGVICTILGPLLPVLSERWALDDAHAGYLFSAQFGGSMLGVMGSSFLMSRRGHRISLLLGLGLMALGAATLLGMSGMLGMISTLCWGLGFGFVIPTTNLLVSDLNPEKRAAALNLVNFSWGVGAATCPFFVAALLRMHSTSSLLYGVAALLILVAAGMSRVSLLVPRPAPDKVSPAESGMWWSRWIPILGALFFLYVGCEAGVAGWTATYAHRMAAGAGTAWAFMPSFFWAALLLGRATAPVLLRNIRELKLAEFGLALSALGVVALLGARNLSLVAIGASFAGLGLASVFPIAIATLSRKFGAMAPRIAGLMFALAGAGGATLPWLVGYISTRLGSLKFGLLVPLVGCIVMLLLNVLLSKPNRERVRDA
jgi:FHS family glucose/mannose:H+ symporter-like MFS transporter